MSNEGMRIRSRQIEREWRPRMMIDPNDRPCYFCASRYIYQWEPCELASIRKGLWAHYDGYDCLPICDEHQSAREESSKA